MKYRQHGANPEKLFEQFNISIPDHIIDFSTNTNVISSSEYEINYIEIASKYPDDECINIRQILSKQLSLSTENILISNGINEVIYLIASLFQGKRVGILAPTYSEYAKALDAFDVNYTYFYQLEDVVDVDCVFLCNPNNPTGNYITHKKLSDFADRMQKNDCHLIIDESYYEFLNQNHQTLDLKIYQNVIILRSLTKFYHLSGLRIGYTLSHLKNIELIKKRQPTWSVNGIALEYAAHCLEDQIFQKQTKEYYKQEVPRFIQCIRKLGLEVINTSVNYFLIKVKNDEELIKFLLTKGIVVRHTRNFVTLEGQYIRIACKKRDENEYFIDCLEEFYNEHNIN